MSESLKAILAWAMLIPALASESLALTMAALAVILWGLGAK